MTLPRKSGRPCGYYEAARSALVGRDTDMDSIERECNRMLSQYEKPTDYIGVLERRADKAEAVGGGGYVVCAS